VTTRITQSAATQRAGRAGRAASGICVRLFSPEMAAALPAFAAPAIETDEVVTVLLRNKVLKREIPLLTPIPAGSAEASTKSLKLLGALSDQEEVTLIGRTLLKLGIPYRLGLFLLSLRGSQTRHPLQAGTLFAVSTQHGMR
jgi:ATP-dependent helicase HrpA